MESRLATLQKSVDDSAKIYRTVFITFLTFIAYFLAVAFSVEHEDLFKNAILKAPILNIGIKTSFYFTWAPFILLLLHLGLLIQAHTLNKKTKSYTRAIKDLSKGTLEEAEALGLLPSLPLTQIADRHNYKKPFKFLLWLFIVLTLILMPVITFGVLLLRFLPYQDLDISNIHWYALMIDLAMSLLFWHYFCLHHTNHKLVLRIASCTGLVAVLIIAFMPPSISSNDSNLGNQDSSKWDLWKRDLWEWDLIKDRVKLALFVPRKRLYLETASSPLDVCMRGDKTLGLNLEGRSYKNADLSGAVLCHAILYEAKLQEANLFNAQLQGAYLRSTNLQGAWLQGAQLQGANLYESPICREANLNESPIAGSESV